MSKSGPRKATVYGRCEARAGYDPARDHLAPNARGGPGEQHLLLATGFHTYLYCLQQLLHTAADMHSLYSIVSLL